MNTEKFILSRSSAWPIMKQRYICSMRIFHTGYMLFALCVSLIAQDHAHAESLTREFASLSAKERTRIAKKEANEAAHDVEFQTLMASADSLFQRTEYEAAIDVYIKARNRRPFNVHPKVKIQDLEDLINSEGEMNGEILDEKAVVSDISDLNSVDPSLRVETPSEDNTATESISKNGVLQNTNGRSDSLFDEPEMPIHESDVKPQSEGDITGPISLPVKSLPNRRSEDPSNTGPKISLSNNDEQTLDLKDNGFKKEVYKEANSLITKLTVTKSGKVDIYKKVHHQWGYTFYFKNGSSITERMWSEETLPFY